MQKRTVEVTCDGPDHDDEHDTLLDACDRNITIIGDELAEQLKAAGWVSIGPERDFCPNCAAVLNVVANSMVMVRFPSLKGDMKSDTVSKSKPKPNVKVPEPDYKGVLGRMYVGNCIEVLKRFRPVSFDAITTDPPFNIGQAYGDGEFSDRMTPEQYEQFTRDWMLAANRVLKPGGAFWVNVPDEVAPNIVMCARQMGLLMVNWIILHQEFGQYGESKFVRSHSHLLYFVKPGKRKWYVKEILEPSRRMETGDSRIETAKHNGFRPMFDVWQGSHLGRVQGNNEERWHPKLHPNQMPEMVLARVIRCCTAVGDSVLDCFAGSGTSGVVAVALQRVWTGIELVPVSAESAWERVNNRGPVREVGGPLYGTPQGERRGISLSKL